MQPGGENQMFLLQKRIEVIEKVLGIEHPQNVDVASAPVNLDIKVDGRISIEASSTLSLRSFGIVDVNGALIKMNDGLKPVAGIGDMVASAPGPITTGSPTVLV